MDDGIGPAAGQCCRGDGSFQPSILWCGGSFSQRAVRAATATGTYFEDSAELDWAYHVAEHTAHSAEVWS